MMSTIALHDRRSPEFSPTALIAASRAAEPRFFALGVFLLVSILPTGLAVLADNRHMDGLELWSKALKFEVALAVYLFTLAFFARYIPQERLQTLAYRLFSLAVVTAILLEMTWIGGAAAMGTSSHFNTSPFGAAVYSLMGALAVLLTSATAVQAVMIARNPSTGLDPVLRQAIVYGLGLTLPLTLATAGVMGGMPGHHVGGVGPVLETVPLMGWAGDRGDMRVAHFFGSHALHAIPIMGLALAALPGRRSSFAVPLAALAYCGFVVAVLLQALAGRPFIPL